VTQPAPRPERIAAAARALGSELRDLLTLYADAVGANLAEQFQMVAWDREQLIGQVQQRLDTLRAIRFHELGDTNVRIIERAGQPLESLELVWSNLRQGRRVKLEWEDGACGVVPTLLRPLARVLRSTVGAEVLHISGAPWQRGSEEPSASQMAFKVALDNPEAPGLWPVVGVRRPGPRVAVVEASADRELAAYVLARTGLRRSGTDPRGVKRAYVVDADERFLRHLKRVWVGAVMGPADDPFSFSGPVTPAVREAFLEAHRQWEERAGVEVLVAGGDLARSSANGCFLAPALFACDWPVPDLPLVGPMMVVVRARIDQARAAAEAAAREGGQSVVVGATAERYPGDVRYIRGALLVERLPPGLPDPRPV
jgi:hypothetical protein